MKLLALFGPIIFFTSMFGQAPRPCPNIVAAGPLDYTITRDQTATTFTVDVSNADAYKLSYLWSVSAGRVISGKQSPNMTVEANLSMGVTATVEVFGLPEKCVNTTSATVMMCFFKPDSVKIDEFSAPVANLDRPRLDRMVLQLGKEPTSTGEIFEIFNQGASRADVEKKLSMLVAYFKSRKVDLNRIVLLVAISGDANLTVLSVRPPGADPFLFPGDGIPIDLQAFRADLAKAFPVR